MTTDLFANLKEFTIDAFGSTNTFAEKESCKKRWNETEKIAQNQIRLEEERAAAVILRHNSLGQLPSLDDIGFWAADEDRGGCSLCRQPTANADTGRGVPKLPCCGNQVCIECMKKYRHSTSTRNFGCPFCRTASFSNAVSELEKNAKEGRAWAQYSLGMAHWTGQLDLSIDADSGIYWLTKAANQGYTPAYIDLSKKLCEMDRWHDALPWLERLMPFDDRTYLNVLGYIYCFETDNRSDDGIRLLTISAKRGDAKGQFYLGKCFDEGVGVPKNLELALYWYTLAARQNQMEAQERVINRLLLKSSKFYTSPSDLNQTIGLVAGCCVVSTVIRWHRLYTRNGGESKEIVVKLEKRMKSRCSCCGQKQEDDTKQNDLEKHAVRTLRRCSQCMVICYCSR